MAPPRRTEPGRLEGVTPDRYSGPIPYTRSLVTSGYTDFPTSTNGRIFASFSEGSRNCTGTVVHSGVDNLRSVVLTAARCVFTEPLGGWAETVTFIPAYRDGNHPFGEWPVLDAFVPTEWIDGGENLHFDVAALHIPPDSSGETLEKDNTGGMGLRWNQGLGSRTVGAFGYPSVPPFTGDLLYKCLSATRSDFPQPPGGGDPTLAIGCDLTQEGTAGGGWIINDLDIRDSYLTSVFSYKVSGEKEVSFGPYFGPRVGELYEEAANPKPIKHKMKLTFKLKGRLTAVGRITARDGYAPCGNNAPIRIQRRQGGKWRNVGETFSKPKGRYKVTVPNRPGLYRAFSPAGSVDAQNVCSSAKSRTRRH
jgi:hypothetical protein